MKYIAASFLFLRFLTLSLLAGIYSGETDNQTFVLLQDQVMAKRTELANKIVEAESSGLVSDYARVSLYTMELFSENLVPWDRANPNVIQAIYDNKGFSRWDPVGPEGLAFDELADCLELGDVAIAELQKQIDGEIVLQAPPDFSTGEVVADGGFFRREGKAVFPSKFFWGASPEDFLTAYGRLGEQYWAAFDLETNTTVRTSRNNSLKSSVSNQFATNRVPLQSFLGHVIPNDFWMRTSHPDAFEAGTREFTDYDIDNPIVRTWMETLFSTQLADLANSFGTGERVHMLSNEPNFSIKQGGRYISDGVSAYTMDKYSDWLQNKYGNIATLNSIYGTSFSSFSAVQSSYTIPLSTSYRGGPVWYDWMKFNMDRVNDWFTYLNDLAKIHDPDGLTHIKLWGEGSIHSDYIDEGIDIEYVTKLVDVPGTDNQSTPIEAQWENRFYDEWKNNYTLDWRSQAITIDFVKSIAPEKVFYDSEWHGFSGGRWVDFHTRPEYVRAILWLGATNGLGGLNVWLFNRRSDWSVRSNAYVGTCDFQPIQMDSFGRTLKELNAHGNVVANLSPKKRNFLIYYNKDSAIQDGDYPGMMADVYESLKIQNWPVGFTTPSELVSAKTVSQTIVVPPTEYISDADLAGLQAYHAAGGRIVVVNPSVSFSRDELGRSRVGGAGFTPFAAIPFNSVFNMADELQSTLSSYAPALPAKVDITTTGGIPAYGILSLQSVNPDSGELNISLVNVSKEERLVSLSVSGESPLTVTNLLTGNATGSSHLMAPYDVLLLSVSLPSPYTDLGWSGFSGYYQLTGEPGDNTDSDDSPDLLEYAAGGNPVDSTLSGTLPEIGINPDGTAVFKITRLSSAFTGITYSAEWTNDPNSDSWSADWDEVVPVTVEPEIDSTLFIAEEYRLVPQNPDRIFARLKIDLDE